MNIVMALFLGVSLSAASGFRVFLPPLALSIAALNGVVQLSSDWEWVGTYPTAIVLGIAAIVEVLAYFIPFVNNMLDSAEIFLAPIAGMFLTASTLSMAGDFDPALVWTLSIITGGTTAEVVEVGTSITRLATTTATAGVANPIVSVVEVISSIVLSILAITLPLLTILIVTIILVDGSRRILRFLSKRKQRRKMKNNN
ncbi:MAG: DUF4126 domain-containing protein [Mastigocoleus sp. MO_167.B18]|nr:DUF4126 domain-containing protein [Mastigocoleus sp. MO_167.B18]